jgi:branched-chain amino acid aminotransferase
MHNHLLHNGEIRGTGEALIAPGQVGFMNGWGVFSTIRVASGVLFAFARHYERMRRDAIRMRVPMTISAEELERQLLSLVEANQAHNATLRVVVMRNHGGLFDSPVISRDSDLVAFTSETTKWDPSARLMYVPHGRFGACPFAGAKVTSWVQNLNWNEEAHEKGFDEAILLNEHGYVSECTSANVFVIQGGEVWTPTLAASGCLPGVTRALLLEEIKVPGLTIRERDFLPADLESADQVFITSTTRNLMPVLSVGGRVLAQNPSVMGSLSTAFGAFVNSYVARHTPQVAAR